MTEPTPDRRLAEALLAGAFAGSEDTAFLEDGPLPGEVFGRYRLLAVLGRGGMGIVHEAWDSQLKRRVALKRILGAADPLRRERFVREARLAARLTHPHIVPVIDFGDAAGELYLTCEYVLGRSLDARLDEGDPVPPERAAAWIRDVALALQHAHDQGVVHRDVKPANLLLDQDDRILLTDFGLAKSLLDSNETEEGTLTLSGVVMGTPHYMSPEQAEGAGKEAGPASDQYSLGAVLYRMLAGRVPFLAEDLLALRLAVAGLDPVPPAKVRPDVPEALSTICLKALAKDPLGRYPSMADLAADLDRFLAGSRIVARKPSAAYRWLVRRRGTAIAALLVVVLAVLAGALVARFRDGEGARQAAESSARAAVLQRWRALAADERRLEAGLHDGTLDEEARRAAARAIWPRFDAFVRETPPDPASQAAMRALAAWALRLAGEPAEAAVWLEDATRLDPGGPYGPFVGALVELANALAVPVELVEPDVPGAGPKGHALADPALARDAIQRAEALAAEVAGRSDEGPRLSGDLGLAIAGVRALLEGRAGDAVAALSRALEASPLDSVRIDLLLARAHAERLAGDDAGALRDSLEVRQARPRSAPVHHLLGRLMLGVAIARERSGVAPLDVYREVVLIASDALALDPGLSAARLDRATARNAIGRLEREAGTTRREEFERASEDASAVLGADPESAPALRCRGLARHALSQIESSPESKLELVRLALDDLSAAVRFAPGAMLSRLALAGGFVERGRILELLERDPIPDLERGVAELDEVQALEPGNLRGLRDRGLALADRGRLEAEAGRDPSAWFARARADLDAAVARRPDDGGLRGERAGILTLQARAEFARGVDPRPAIDAALDDFEAAIRAAPPDAELRRRRGTLQALRGWATAGRGGDPVPDFTRAVEDLDAAIAADPRDVSSLTNRALAREKIGDALEARGEDPATRWEEALADWTTVLELAPGRWDLRFCRANVLEGLGRWDEAIAENQRATATSAGQASKDFARVLERLRTKRDLLGMCAQARAALGEGDPGRARELLEPALASLAKLPQPDWPIRLARIEAHLDAAAACAGSDPGAAFANLSAAADLGFADRARVEAAVVYESLRADPRWRAILDRLR